MQVDPAIHQRRPLANILWLTTHFQSAESTGVVIGHTGEMLREAFTGHCSSLRAFNWSDIGDAPLPVDDKSADLLAVETFASGGPQGAACLQPSASELTPFLGDCRRVLRSPGTLVLVGQNPLWFRRLRPIRNRSVGDVGIHALQAALARVGFSDVCPFLLTPSHSDPKYVIPAESAVVRLHERVVDRSHKAILKQALTFLGGSTLLHPAHLILASS